jgi:hypothetical protein
MQEFLTAATYLVAWLICDKVFEIESGLVKLIISLGAAIAVYIICGMEELRKKKVKSSKDER